MCVHVFVYGCVLCMCVHACMCVYGLSMSMRIDHQIAEQSCVCVCVCVRAHIDH